MTETGRNAEDEEETVKSVRTVGGDAPMEHVSTRVPEELEQRVKEEADERGVPVAQVLREATQAYLRGPASDEVAENEEPTPSDVIEVTGSVEEDDEDDEDDGGDRVEEDGEDGEDEEEGGGGLAGMVLLGVLAAVAAAIGRNEQSGVSGR